MLANEFITKYGITGDVTFVTDFSEDSPYGPIPRRRWTATLVHKGRTLTVPYSTGTQANDPQVSEVLYCVGSDAQAGSLDLDEFLGEFGAEEIEKQRETWRACRDASKKAYDWVSSEAMWDDLRMVEEG